jgi:hypothetical protein
VSNNNYIYIRIRLVLLVMYMLYSYKNMFIQAIQASMVFLADNILCAAQMGCLIVLPHHFEGVTLGGHSLSCRSSRHLPPLY